MIWRDTTVAQSCAFSLSGHVQDADTKENLSGAVVSVKELSQTFTTDENGNFRYLDICKGTYTIRVTHVGCALFEQEVVVTKNMHLDILMPHLRNNLAEVVVSGTKLSPALGFKQQLSAADLESSRGFSIADALGKINGVNLLQTGATIAKPVIHGLHSIRVLTINNGLRHEGQQWGMEHAPEIDNYVADRLTVIKGVDELKYGSDAIGGVVLVDPRPIRAIPGYLAEINTGYFTNNGQYIISGSFEEQLKKLTPFSYRVQGTYKRGGNIKTPGYRINNTGVEETNFSGAVNWKKEHYQLQAYYSEFQTSIGMFPYSHVGNITDLMTRIEQEQPDDIYLNQKTYDIGRPRQEVVHRLFKLKSAFNFNQHKLSVVLGGQYNHRSEYDIVRNSAIRGPQISLALTTFSEEIAYEHPVIKNFSGVAGVNLSQQDNTYSGRYLIPNYTSHTYGAYWIEKWKRNKLELQAGLRFDNKTINTSRLRYGGQVNDYDFDFATVAASFGSGFKISNSIKVNAGATLSSRAPQVNELLSAGIHQASGGYSFLQGNINLKTEKSVNLNAGMQVNGTGKLSAEIYLYHHIINDFIYMQPRPDQPVLTITGAAPKLEYLQTDAYLTGADISVSYELTSQLHITSRASVLHARNRRADDWLILMPADRWRNELTYNFNNGKRIREAYLSAEYVQVFKPRVPSDEPVKQDYKAPPPEYGLLNMNASTTLSVFSTPVTVGFSVRNIFNTSYRDYMNLFRYYSDEMGRNFIIRFKISFESIKF